MLKSSSQYYRQAPGVVGEFIEDYTMASGWVVVRWNQKWEPGRPDEDNYPIEDLLPATKLDKLLAGVDSEV